MPVDDYYTLIGVSADADRDEIKDAYRVRRSALADDEVGRAESAKLNRAWNVLSDQAQRDRYDDQLAEAKANDEVVVPELVGGASTNGAGTKSRSAQRREQAANRRSDRPVRQQIPIVTEVNGVPLATNRERVYGLIVDMVICVLVLMVAVPLVSQSLAKSQRPEVIQVRNELKKELDKTQKQIDAAIKTRDSAKSSDAKTAADSKKKAFEKQYDEILKKSQKNESKLTSLNALVLGVGILLLLLVLAVPTALTGRSPGKALRKTRLIRDDGSPAGWAPSLKHYLAVFAIIFIGGFVPIIGQVAFIIAVFGVTSFVRNPKRQGWHDRFAHTVVAAG